MAHPDSAAPPSLFQYLDYRVFLKDFFAHRKVQDRHFSLRSFARVPGLAISSSSFLSAVIKGRKNLSQSLRLRFARALQLKPGETEYFELLVQCNQARGRDEKAHYLAQLSRFHSSGAKLVPESDYQFYARWYYSVVWNYFGMHQNRNNPAQIARDIFPALSARQVEESIRVLLDLKLIKKLANGYAVMDRHLSTGAFRGPVARQYHREFIQLALDNLDRVPPPERQYHVLSLALSRQACDRIRERIQSFRAELREIAEQDKQEDRIYALALQFFPCSRPAGAV